MIGVFVSFIRVVYGCPDMISMNSVWRKFRRVVCLCYFYSSVHLV